VAQYSAVWNNASWNDLSLGRTLQNCLSTDHSKEFDVWLGDGDTTGSVFNLTIASIAIPFVKSRIENKLTAEPLLVLTALGPGQSVRRDGERSINIKRFSPSLPWEVTNMSPIVTVPKTTPRLDCRYLVDTYDWASTTLGPRSSWPSLLESMVSLVLASPTQDCVWVGNDFPLI
jgi:hypothetical protein